MSLPNSWGDGDYKENKRFRQSKKHEDGAIMHFRTGIGLGLGLGLGLGFRIGLGLGLRCESALAPMKTIASFVCDFVFLQHGRQTSVF